MKKLIKIFVNLLTISRIIFSIFLIFNATKLSNITFLMIVAILFLTDQLDGFLARKYKVQTLFGAVMDTVADKILCITLIIPLILGNRISLIILIGELAIGLTNLIAVLNKRKTTVSFIGKVKMWLLSISIIVGYLVSFGYIPKIIFNISCVITFVIQLYVLIKYILLLKGRERIGNSNISIEFKLEKLFDTDYYLKNL